MLAEAYSTAAGLGFEAKLPMRNPLKDFLDEKYARSTESCLAALLADLSFWHPHWHTFKFLSAVEAWVSDVLLALLLVVCIPVFHCLGTLSPGPYCPYFSQTSRPYFSLPNYLNTFLPLT